MWSVVEPQLAQCMGMAVCTSAYKVSLNIQRQAIRSLLRLTYNTNAWMYWHTRLPDIYKVTC